MLISLLQLKYEKLKILTPPAPFANNKYLVITPLWLYSILKCKYGVKQIKNGIKNTLIHSYNKFSHMFKGKAVPHFHGGT